MTGAFVNQVFGSFSMAIEVSCFIAIVDVNKTLPADENCDAKVVNLFFLLMLQ